MKYKPAPFWVVRQLRANELWLGDDHQFTNDLKEARRFPEMRRAMEMASRFDEERWPCRAESFDEAQRRTVRLHAEGGK